MAMTELKFKAERGTYNNHPTLTLTSGDNERFPFRIGLQKAKRIIACLEDIKKFIEECEAAAPKEPVAK